MSSIAVSYHSLEQLSNRSTESSKRISDTVDDLHGQLSALHQHWTGASYAAFREEMDKWERSAHSLARVLTQIASMVDKTAVQYGKLEDQVVKMFAPADSSKQGKPAPKVDVPPPPRDPAADNAIWHL